MTCCCTNERTLLANSPDWLKAAPMRENLLASWRQFGQKQDHCPSLLNHNAKYKRLLPPRERGPDRPRGGARSGDEAHGDLLTIRNGFSPRRPGEAPARS